MFCSLNNNGLNGIAYIKRDSISVAYFPAVVSIASFIFLPSPLLALFIYLLLLGQWTGTRRWSPIFSIILFILVFTCVLGRFRPTLFARLPGVFDSDIHGMLSQVVCRLIFSRSILTLLLAIAFLLFIFHQWVTLYPSIKETVFAYYRLFHLVPVSGWVFLLHHDLDLSEPLLLHVFPVESVWLHL